MGSDDNGLFSNSRLTALLVGIGSAGIVVFIYHCISVALYYRQRHQARQHQGLASRRLSEGPGPVTTEVPVNPSIENSTVNLTPAHKYRRGDVPVAEETICSICLCEFEDGEEIRSLPDCIHSFHAPCIDTWLYSHSSCPMCRADATHSPVILPVPNGPDPEAVEGTRDEQVTSVHVPEAVP